LSKTTSPKSKNKSHDRIFDGIIEILFGVFKITTEAFKTRFYKKKENWVLYFSLVMVCYVTFIKGHYEYLIEFFAFSFVRPVMVAIARNFSYFSIFLLVSLFVGFVFILFVGLKPYKRFRMYQQGLDHLNMKSGLDHRPKLLRVDEIDGNRTRLLVKSTGLGEERYKSKLDDLRASVGQKIESVRYFNDDNTCVEIFLALKLLESKVLYADLVEHLKRPYSFIVGKSQKGIVTENLEDVPHYMIGGSTGGGKSVSFKSILMGLLESSTNLQIYLFDFKRVEMNDFQGLPNVVIVNEEFQAQQVLEKLEKEMERRYKMLEKDGFKSIDPKRDKLDRIVVGIDECTDLTGKVAKSNPSYVTIEKARNSLDNLARKARASGIHLIFATQKIDSDSLDTRVQENIEGRLALRMNTMENSVRVLQNSMAYHLPPIPGRAIWKRGSSYTEVQTPFLSDEELKDRVQKLIKSEKYSPKKMLDPKTVAAKKRQNVKGFLPEEVAT
jgi:S-DNA-T family DNA segregation ATPase FtsK/SpoIIIE